MKQTNNEIPTSYPSSHDVLQTKVTQRFEEILQGQQYDVYKGNVPSEPPAWFDPVKFEKGKQFFQRYMCGIFLANLVALVVGLASPQVLKPLMFTRKSDTPRRAFRRYVQTVVYVYSWYVYDVWNPKSPGGQSISIVRDLHSHAANGVNHPDNKEHVQQLGMETLAREQNKFKNLSGETQALPAFLTDFRPNVLAHPNLLLHPNYRLISSSTNPSLQCPFMSNASPNLLAEKTISFINQTDMSFTQFAFLGLVLMYPEKFGAANATKEELEGFIHFWRGIGYLLGIDDRFNFCREDNYVFTRELCLLTMDRLVKYQLASANEEYDHMSRVLLQGTRYYLPMYTLDCILLYVAYVTGMAVPNLTRVVPWSAWLHYWYLRIVFSVLCNIPLFLKLYNYLLRCCILAVVNPHPNDTKFFKPPRVYGLEKFFP